MSKRERLRNLRNNIRKRCCNPENPYYADYGARGITLSPEWDQDLNAFCQYVESLPNYGSDKTLDRIDNDVGYVEGNLQWVSQDLQNRNRRKFKINTSGVTGVAFSKNGNYERVVAYWNEGVEQKRVYFSIKRYGLLPAFARACEYREAMINKLNSQGANYSSKHGK